MRDRSVRLVFLGLILASPPLIAALAGATPGRDLAGAELLVMAGLGYAARWRRREAPGPAGILAAFVRGGR